VLSLNVELSEVKLLRLRATYHTLPLLYLRKQTLRAKDCGLGMKRRYNLWAEVKKNCSSYETRTLGL